MTFKTVATFIHGGHPNQEQSFFGHSAIIAGCLQSVMLGKNANLDFRNFGKMI